MRLDNQGSRAHFSPVPAGVQDITPSPSVLDKPDALCGETKTTVVADCDVADRAIPTPPFRLVRVTKKGGSLSKRIARTASGGIEVDSSACAMSRGEAITVAVDDGMAGLAKLYGSLGHNEAVVLSNAGLGPQAREICTEAAYGGERRRNPNIICRAKRFLAGVAAPGLQLFEVDDHGLPDGISAPDATQMVAILEELLPELDVAGAAKLMTHSTSSFIYDASTGEELKGEGGKHLAILLSDQSRAKDLKTLLEVRQWANGHGHIYISRDGKQHKRTVFDLSVFAPERLVFEAGALLPPDLEQRRPAVVATEGHALDMARLPLPTLAERELADKAIRIAMDATRAAAEKARAAYIQTEGTKLAVERGLSQPEAERIVALRAETQSLDDGDVLIFSDKGRQEARAIGYVLDHIEEYVGRPICDPLEPERGPSKAMILRGPGGQPYVQSFVHGGRRFTFERILGREGAADQALFDFSDLANAHRLAAAYGGGLIATASGWYVFDGRRWERADHLAERKALNLSRLVLQDPKYLALVEEVKRNDFGDKREAKDADAQLKKWSAHAALCENKAKIAAALNVARTLLWRDVEEMNPDPWLLNVLNGTIDLRTGVMRAHDRDDLITVLAPVEYDPSATCPAFEKTVLEALGGDVELVAFLQRFLGYCLTGLTLEQKILIPWGDGSNGKGTILGAVQKVLGKDYCGVAPPKLLEATHSDRHPTEIADLYGKRLVIASETEEGAQLREAFLKLATGSDPLKGRFMRKDFFEFEATHKFILQTNHKPEVKGTDYAIWRRLLLLPFEVIFGDQADIDAGDARRLKDRSLPDKLSGEAEGVLAWLVRGCAEWRRLGLAETDTVRAATGEYREEQDRIGQFVAEHCEYDAQQSIEQTTLYSRYKGWAAQNGYYPMGSGKFRKQFLKAARGKVTVGRTTTGTRKNVAAFQGVRVSDGGDHHVQH